MYKICTYALFVDFDIVYENIKSGKTTITNIAIEKKIMESKNLVEYLRDGVYLQFDGTDIENERNFENECTGKVISPNRLNACGLKNTDDDSI